jgi:hypothetical protein
VDVVCVSTKGTENNWEGPFAVNLKAEPLKMRPIGCPETSVTDYKLTLRNIAEDERSHIHCGGSLKSHTLRIVYSL